MTRVLMLCLAIAIASTSATACRGAWRASRPARGGARVVREISRTQEQTPTRMPTRMPTATLTHAGLVEQATRAAPTPQWTQATPKRHTIAQAPTYSPELKKFAAKVVAAAYVDQGNDRARAGEYAAAIAEYDEALQLQPDYAHAYYYRGLVKAALGQQEAAVADLDTAFELAKEAGDIGLIADIADAKRKIEAQ